MVPFDPERTEEITMAAKQRKIPFDMMKNGMYLDQKKTLNLRNRKKF